jgi:methionyl-tRNA synthetase
MDEKKRYLITSALPYVNGPLHIGHVAGAYLPADIYVRHLRRKGCDVAFICGSDEHGAAITMRARKEGVTPKEIVDKYHAIVKKAFADFNISFDIYHRTTAPIHYQTARDFFTILVQSGALTVEKSMQYYDAQEQQFLADRYITGTCPKCGHDSAFGDQCEKCGSALSPSELIQPRSTLSGQTPVLRETSHWYLPMDRHAEWMREYIEKGTLDGVIHHDPNTWRNHVVGQCKSWIDGGLQPRAMTRDLDWGVPVPLPDAEGKVLYVWMDAPIGYISATREWAAQNGKNWEDYWKNPEARLIHFIGKDNIVFHCIIFPMLLRLHGGFNLPVNVVANEFLNLEGQKLSTSRNWAVWLHEYLEDFPGRIDELRYVLTSIAPETKDSEFTWKDYQARVNNELVAILGNFVNRVMVLFDKFYEGKIPDVPTDTSLLAEIRHQQTAQVVRLLDECKFREAQFVCMDIARRGNKYLADREPWKTFKTDAEATANVMLTALEITVMLADVLSPFLPATTQRILKMLRLETPVVPPAGHQLDKPELLFTPVPDEAIDIQIEKLKYAAGKAAQKPAKPMISFDDFTKLDLRVGEIVAAEKVEKADKLLKLQIALGDETRTVVSGIAGHYAPEQALGRKVLFLANLEPRKIRGIDSQGMVLMAEDAEGRLSFLSPEKEGIPGGAEVR